MAASAEAAGSTEAAAPAEAWRRVAVASSPEMSILAGSTEAAGRAERRVAAVRSCHS